MTTFNEDAVCPKCGFGIVTCNYTKRQDIEFILRKCGRCGYTWDEDTVDIKQEKQ